MTGPYPKEPVLGHAKASGYSETEMIQLENHGYIPFSIS